MYTVNEIYSSLNAAFPFCEAEGWDNSGILVDSDAAVSKILVALDATIPVIEEAVFEQAQLIVTHHPVIFHPLRTLLLEEPAVRALRHSVAIISAHTNFDVGYLSADSLFSETLAQALAFREEGILDVTQQEPHPHGFGRVGRLQKTMNSQEFAQSLKSALNCDCLRFTPTDRPIRRVAFCCGGGGEYFQKVISQGFDAYITSDVKHSAFIEALNTHTALFAPTHYQMEKPAMLNLVALLKQSFPDAEILLSQRESEPSQII